MLNINESNVDEAGLITLQGQLDGQSSGALQTAIFGFIEERYHVILLDVGDLTYISSAGLRVLLMAQKRLKPKQGELRLIGVQPMVMDVLKITGFDTFFRCFTSLQAALPIKEV